MNNQQGKRKDKLHEEPSFIMYSLAWGWIGFVLLIALFNNGSFQGFGIHNPASYRFEKPVLYTLLVAVVIMFWLAMHFQRKTLTWNRSLLFGIAALVLPITYALGSLRALSPYLAHYGILAHVLLFVFFVAGIRLTSYSQIIRWFPTVYLVFGYLIVIYGFLSLFGNVYMLDALTPQDGIRIASIFQYPNAYAVLLLTLWIGILIEIDRVSNRIVQVFHGLMLFPVCVSFLLTLSRGALIVLPIVAIVALTLFRLRQQVMAIIYSILGMGISLAIYNTISERGIAVIKKIQQAAANKVPFDTVSVFSRETVGYWGLLIFGSIVMGALVYVVERFITPRIAKMSERFHSDWANRWIPLSLIAVFVLGAIAIATDAITRFLPPIIRGRVENINFQTHSVYERLTMYKDAIAVWKENPVFGAGAGAWEALYEKYQSYPYSSAQTHSFFTQLLVETGIVGLILVAVFILAVLITFYRTYRKANEEERSRYVFYMITPVAILLHSLIDFEMTYLLYGFLVFTCLGILAGAQRAPLLEKWNESRKRLVQQTAAIVMGIGAIFILIVSSKWLYSINQFEKYTYAINHNLSYEDMMSALKSGLKQNPNHPLLLNQAGAINYQVYEQTKDTKYLEEAKHYDFKLVKREPYYQAGLYLNYAIHLAEGNNEEALRSIEQAISLNKYNQNYYEQAVSVLIKQWDAERQSGNSNNQAGEKIISIYEKMNRLLQEVDRLPDTVILSKNFGITSAIRAAAGQVYYFKGDYAQAEEVLKPGLKEDLSQPNDRYVARFYLASLRKQGKDDPALYEKLLQADQGEGAMLEQLLQ
ncbi:O-antigen ligase family protein [Cohnella laeviribosi]|uniref:O-antigen ligase family protein n=1 Tax=Cohnella laeviribosi TaxID=380174 RepID=UPI00036170E3|nr:O-antigen ligase family protein [Cohnella laeviribosi]